MSIEVEREEEPSCVLKLSDLEAGSEREFTRRAELLAKVERGEESVLRDVMLSVRKSVEDSDRVMVGSSSVMLSLVSEYFTAMFEGDSSKGETLELSDKITLPGIRAINALAFGALSSVEVRSEHLASLIAAAQYCKVPALTELCNEFIRRNDAMNDIGIVHGLLKDLTEFGFTQRADEVMDQLSPDTLIGLLMDTSVLDMSSDMLIPLLKSDNLAMHEEDIWLRCVEWARHQSDSDDIKATLLKIKHCIRYPSLDEKCLTTDVMSTEVLSHKEYFEVMSFKYGSLKKSGLFCPSQPRIQPRKMFSVWHKNHSFSRLHSLSEDYKTLTDISGRGWRNAVVLGTMKSGRESVEFEISSGNGVMIGVMEATELSNPEKAQHFGGHLKGVGYSPLYAKLHGHGFKGKSFGHKCKVGDRVRVTVEFADDSHASMVFHRNGLEVGHSVELHQHLDVSQGLKFAVQICGKSTQVRIVDPENEPNE